MHISPFPQQQMVTSGKILAFAEPVEVEEVRELAREEVGRGGRGRKRNSERGRNIRRERKEGGRGEERKDGR